MVRSLTQGVHSMADRAARVRWFAHVRQAGLMLVWVSATAALVSVGGCAFNVEEQTETVTWYRDVAGAARMIIDDEAFDESDISVEGADGDSLVFSCVLRRLVAAGDESIDDLELRAGRRDETVELSLLTSGDDWIVYELDDIDMRLARGLELDVRLLSGSLDVCDYDGFVKATVNEGEVDIDTRRGCDVIVESGDVAVSLVADQLDPALDSTFDQIDIEVTSGSVDIRVPPQLRARLSLSVDDGEITVLGEKVGDTEFEGILNGGHADHRIRCRVKKGDVTIAHVQAF